MIKFRALALVDRQGIDGFMGGQTDRGETTQPAGRVPEECAQFPVAFRIVEDEPDIANEPPRSKLRGIKTERIPPAASCGELSS